MRRTAIVVGIIFALLVITQVQASAQTGMIYGCVNNRTGALRIVSGPGECGPKEGAISWNQVGPQGPTGKCDCPSWNDYRKAHEHLRLDLSGAQLSNLDLRHAALSEADLGEADLSGTDLSGSELVYANLCRAVLAERGHRFGAANLSGADLTRAALAEADLTNVNLSHACLMGAELRGARLLRANV